MHHVSREVDDDIFADFLWGMITGYDADAAMKMVNNSTEPLLVKDAVATIMELNSAKWFDNYAWVDDHTRGLWGEKKGRDAEIKTYQIDPKTVLKMCIRDRCQCDWLFSELSVGGNKRVSGTGNTICSGRPLEGRFIGKV